MNEKVTLDFQKRLLRVGEQILAFQMRAAALSTGKCRGWRDRPSAQGSRAVLSSCPAPPSSSRSERSVSASTASPSRSIRDLKKDRNNFLELQIELFLTERWIIF